MDPGDARPGGKAGTQQVQNKYWEGNKPENKVTNESIVSPRAAEMHLENHRYRWTVSKKTQSEGLQWELKVEKFKDFFKKWKNVKSYVYRDEKREV